MVHGWARIQGDHGMDGLSAVPAVLEQPVVLFSFVWLDLRGV